MATTRRMGRPIVPTSLLLCLSILFANEQKALVVSTRKMMGPIVRCLFFLFFLLLVAPSLGAQNLHLRVETPKELSTPPMLYLYDQGEEPRIMEPTSKNDSVFRYATTITHPVFAYLKHSTLPGQLPLFLEPGVVRVTLNLSDLQRSAVHGSQTTTQFRYALEICRQSEDPSTLYPCLENQVNTNPTSIWAPYILYNHLMMLPCSRQQQLLDRFSGEALSVPQYKMIQHRIDQLRKVDNGNKMPDFRYHDTLNTELSFHLLLQPNVYHVFCFGATWCEHCPTVVAEIDHAASRYQNSENTVLVHSIDTDREEEGWDSPMMQQLAISYLPQIMIVSPDGIIVRRDLRSWEVGNVLDSLFLAQQHP